jgi:MFS superfamily sulfate permease-like transporter/rhodanese-related sulfurtransferase
MNHSTAAQPMGFRARAGEIFVAGTVSALTAFPLSIGFALLAGVPPVVMVAASVYSALFNAALAGRYGVGGPNTAVAMLTGAALMPYAPAESDLYMGYVFALCVLVGIYQLLFALILRKVDLMDYVSTTVIDGITVGIGAVFVLTSLWMAAGLAQPGGAQWTVFHALMSVDRTLAGDGNSAAVLVAGVTILVGVLCWQFKAVKRFAILIGLIAAFIVAQWFDESARLEYVGWLSMPLFSTSLPDFRQVSWPVVFGLAGGPAIAIALVGTLQTLSIAKAIRDPDEAYRPAREMLSQGLQHLFMGFFSGAPVSNSFNKSALKRDLGGGRSSLIFSAVVTVAMIYLAGGVVADIPMSALGGALILVGMGMLNLRKYRHHLSSGVQSAMLFFLPAALVVVLDIQSALLIGFGLSLLAHFWTAAKPNVLVEEHVARDGRHVSVVTIDGNLFFGSLRYVERVLARVGDPNERSIILLRTDHLTYLDVPGAGLLAEEAMRRRKRGDELFVFATRKLVIDTMEKAGALSMFGEDHIIYRDRSHPMKELLYPFRPRDSSSSSQGAEESRNILREEEGMDVIELARRLRATTVFAHVPADQLVALIEQEPKRFATVGTDIADTDQGLSDHLVLLSGEVAVSRTWIAPDDVEQSHHRRVGVGEGGPGFALVNAFGRNIRVRALTHTRYIRISGEAVDDLLGWSQLSDRMLLAKHLKVFHKVPLEHVKMAFERMVELDVEAGQSIVTQGELGDRYYIILSGEAEVWQVDPFTDETSLIRVLGEGDAFGEESLLQNAYRTATVKMSTPGRLLALAKADFDELLKPVMSEEVSAEEAKTMLDEGAAKLLDCRYDMEFEDSRIPGAKLVPLDKLRQGVSTIDPDPTYIVYCRSGRRSRAAAFLLNERGIKAYSLVGGIKEWPFSIESAEN